MSRLSLPLVTAALASAVILAGCAPKHENVVHVIAEQAFGLKKSARVQYRGVEVGFVKQVYFTPGGVRIDLLIERQDVPIRTQDSVQIKSEGPFAEQVVEIVPGVQTAPLISRGATLARVQPESTVALPVGVWRSIVRSLGFATDSAVVDSVAKKLGDSVARKATDSATRKAAPAAATAPASHH